MQVVVFNLYTPGNIMRALLGDVNVGTTISHLPDIKARQEEQLVTL